MTESADSSDPDLRRYRSVPESLWCNIEISRPDDSAVLDRSFEEERRVAELVKGFFVEKWRHVKYSPLSVLKNKFQGVVVLSCYRYNIKKLFHNILLY
jgi:hypothetical protein